MNPTPLRFETDEFVLRRYEPEDGEALLDAVNESREELLRWIPWVAACETAEVARDMATTYRADFDARKEFRLVIRKGDRMLGGTAFLLRGSPIAWEAAEIGMWIRTGCAGQGLATRVLQAMIDWGFGEWGWKRLVWKCDVLNVGSVKVAEKCGFVREGMMRSDYVSAEGTRNDSYLYALLPSDLAPVSSKQ